MNSATDLLGAALVLVAGSGGSRTETNSEDDRIISAADTAKTIA